MKKKNLTKDIFPFEAPMRQITDQSHPNEGYRGSLHRPAVTIKHQRDRFTPAGRMLFDNNPPKKKKRPSIL
jgi:hypothetical protein